MVYAIHVYHGGYFALFYLGGILLAEAELVVCACGDVLVHGPSDAIYLVCKRVDGVAYFGHVLTVRPVAQVASVNHFESSVELDDEVLFSEGFPSVRYVL